MLGLTACNPQCVLHSVELGTGFLKILTVLRRVSSVQYDWWSICTVLGPMPGARGFKMMGQGLCPQGAH